MIVDYNLYNLRHREYLMDLFDTRGIPLDLIKELPRNGFLDMADGAIPIASGFLRLIEGNFGLLDGFVTNPSFSSLRRDQALRDVTEALINRAKQLNLSNLFAFSSSDSIVGRSANYGFEEHRKMKIISLSLNGSKGIWDF